MAHYVMVLFGLLALLFCSDSCQKAPQEETRTREKIIVGTLPLESFALLCIADEMHFFAGSGLDVIQKDYVTGVASSDALLGGEVDIAGTAEFPIVEKALRKEKIRIIANIDRDQSMYLIGRKDRGIRSISDLRGKRIALPRETIAEFYLGRCLELHHMTVRDIILIDIKPPGLNEAVTNGEADAVLAWQPFFHDIKSQLGANGVSWPAQSSQVTYWILTCRSDWIAEHPDLVRRFLKSLVQVEDYVINHPSESRSIVKRRMHYDNAYVEEIWPEHQFSLSIDQSLILAMEDEGRWLVKNNLMTVRVLPDFLDFIYLDGLEAEKPGSVDIIYRKRRL